MHHRYIYFTGNFLLKIDQSPSQKKKRVELLSIFKRSSLNLTINQLARVLHFQTYPCAWRNKLSSSQLDYESISWIITATFNRLIHPPLISYPELWNLTGKRENSFHENDSRIRHIASRSCSLFENVAKFQLRATCSSTYFQTAFAMCVSCGNLEF